MGRVAKAEQHHRLATGSAQLLMPGDERDDADPAADEQRPDPVRGGAEPQPERAGQPHVLAGAQLGESRGAGADLLEQELELLGAGPVAQIGQRPGKERPALLSPAQRSRALTM